MSALLAYGSLGGAVTVAALRYGDRPGLTDEAGTLSFTELDLRSNALANAWQAINITHGSTVGILCRNHRGLLDAVFAAAKTGAGILLLNVDFAAAQVREVCAREGVGTLVYDAEFTHLATTVDTVTSRFVAWTGRTSYAPPDRTLESLIAEGDTAPPAPPIRHSPLIVLTSGTTGSPKGARRERLEGFALSGAVLSKVPFRSGEAAYVAPPVFHGLGLLATGLNLALGSTVVTRRHFDARQVLASMASQHCAGLVLVPVMLKRILDLGEDTIARYDLSGLRIILSGGAPLGSTLARRATSVFGDVLYNLYGTTEAACAAIATPADLRAAPSCVGRPPFGTTVKLLDAHARELPRGATGAIHIGASGQFTGYTGGGTGQRVRGLMPTGDVGHFDAAGRLFVDGRDDEMIVSAGENVFPGEVADLLAGHPAVADAAVIGIPDEDFGQALRAFVVRRAGQELTADDVRNYVRTRLARYQVPRSVVFVKTLPRVASGKVLVRKLPAGEL
ncbi:AMP-binding protein [Streptomyces sp. RB6PN25]|uniref:AMP-binding protein n=1 Tax=Streptomyces humicola TaxID=2953240 RepID=A0ABT1Q7Q9_9ACTN|nr:AMP-binding protein [Streptomyces humicola]MCQ4084817.1 AMP-binding protein [Streptomyces humicola]